jgi:hypothetical protein
MKYRGLFLCAALALSQVAQAQIVAHYPLNGEPNDIGPDGWNGTEMNGVSSAESRSGTADAAYRFDGVDDHIVAENQIRLENQVTVAAWMRPEAQKTQIILRQGQMARGVPFELATTAMGTITFKVSTDQGQFFVAAKGYPIGEWSHVAGSYDGRSVRIFLNGQAVAEKDAAGQIANEDAPLFIGTRLASESNTFLGALDDVRIFANGMDGAQVNQLMRAPEFPRTSVGLVAAYPLNGDTNDATDHGLDARVVGDVDTGDHVAVFNGGSLRVGPDPLLNVVDGLTIAAWVMPKNKQTQTIVHKGASARTAPFGLSISQDGHLIFGLMTADTHDQLRISGYEVGTWWHVAATYDGQMMRVYVNGKQVGERSQGGPIIDDGSELLIGTRSGASGDTFIGAMDDVHLFDQALDAEAIGDIYSARHR